ncbi:hypothetical protein GCM10017687_27580 [Streptomyces echinatus]
MLLSLAAQHDRGEWIHEHLRGDLVRQLRRYGDDHLGIRHDPLGPRTWLREDRYAPADLDTWGHTRMWADCLHHAPGLDAGWNLLCTFPRVGLDGLQITRVHRECSGPDEDLTAVRCGRLRLLDDGQDVGGQPPPRA